MYIVFIAGSIPTLKPFFRKNFSDPTNHTRRNTRFDGDDGTVLTSTPMPPGCTTAYATTIGRKPASQMYDDDSTEENFIGNGRILRTTKIDVSSEEECEVARSL